MAIVFRQWYKNAELLETGMKAEDDHLKVYKIAVLLSHSKLQFSKCGYQNPKPYKVLLVVDLMP